MGTWGKPEHTTHTHKHTANLVSQDNRKKNNVRERKHFRTTSLEIQEKIEEKNRTEDLI